MLEEGLENQTDSRYYKIKLEGSCRAHFIPLPTLSEFSMFECCFRGILTIEVVFFNFNSLHNSIHISESIRRRRFQSLSRGISIIENKIKVIAKKFFWGFEPAKMHWDIYSITNAFQIIFYAISNFICYWRWSYFISRLFYLLRSGKLIIVSVNDIF